MKAEPTYEELTAEAERAIRKLIGYSISAKNRGDVVEWGAFRDQADGVLHLWREVTDDRPEKEADAGRLEDMIPWKPGDFPPVPEDHTELLQKISALVNDESQWGTPEAVAFSRGRITGMCHHVGIGMGRNEQEGEAGAAIASPKQDESA